MNFAGALTRAFETAGIRGAPTILSKLSKIPALGKRVATVALPSGVPISFPAYDVYWCRYLYAGAIFEADVEAIFRLLGKGRVLVDCGANIGFWSARHKEFGFTRAIAIEANPKLIPFLRLNHSGEIHHSAVHAKSGETRFLARDGAQGTLAETGIPVRTLALADLNITEPALVKLDVEGSEIPAIEGAGEMDAIYVYEDWPPFGMPVTEYLLKRGFHVFGMGDKLTPITSADQGAHFRNHPRGPANLVATRRITKSGEVPVEVA